MKKFVGFIFVILFFGFWELAASQNWIDTQFVPAFSTVIKEMAKMIQLNMFWEHIYYSVFRLALGIVIAVLVALPLGFILATKLPKVAGFVTPFLTNLSLINAFTLMPIFIILFKTGETSKIVIIFWCVVFPALFSTMISVTNFDPILIKAAKAMGTNGIKMFFAVILPGCFGRILTGIKTSVTFGFTVLIAVEELGADSGLGWLVHNAEKNYNIPRMYVGILLIAIIGIIVATLLDKLQEWSVRWESKEVM
ncbi:ABC transporter permease [Ruminiclostridium josui]|uniref:ABC transporter permease n=1 Tax=Ruminiclostridium josui TaxID=1499 RepID=UPI000464C200|nr:ABC transporter permease subunit [Ruminiclostridium josui]